MLSEDELRDALLLVFANKQVGLVPVFHRSFCVIPCVCSGYFSGQRQRLVCSFWQISVLANLLLTKTCQGRGVSERETAHDCSLLRRVFEANASKELPTINHTSRPQYRADTIGSAQRHERRRDHRQTRSPLSPSASMVHPGRLCYFR
jgi:hypothetical protein